MTTVNARLRVRARPAVSEGESPLPGGPSGLVVERLKPAYQQVADQLRSLIINRELASGDRLPPEGELASSFGVSRSTVREALRVLASQGLVETTRGTTGGTFVARINPAAVTSYLETSFGLMSGTEDLALADLLEARDLIEVPAAALAAERHQAEHVEALRDAVAREKASRGRSGKFSEHRQFHGLIMAATGNSLLRMTTDPIFRVLQSHYLQRVDAQDFWSTVDLEHERIVECIANGDGPGASAAMRTHLDSIRPAYHD